MGVGRQARGSFLSFPVFALFVMLTLGMAGVIGLITFDVIDLGMTHFGETDHLVHDLTFGLVFATAIVGVVAQLRSPTANVAGMVMALIPWAALLLAGVLASDVERVLLRNPSILVIPLVATTAVLHPSGRTFFDSFRIGRINWSSLALLAAVAVPLTVFAISQLRLQSSVGDMHAVMGHYGFMAAFSFTVTGVGILASLRPVGWKLPAWITGLLPVGLGVTSIAFPVTSSLSRPWALGAIAWGVAFIGSTRISRGSSLRDVAGADQLDHPQDDAIGRAKGGRSRSRDPHPE